MFCWKTWLGEVRWGICVWTGVCVDITGQKNSE